jgi:hypothetical protein
MESFPFIGDIFKASQLSLVSYLSRFFIPDPNISFIVAVSSARVGSSQGQHLALFFQSLHFPFPFLGPSNNSIPAHLSASLWASLYLKGVKIQIKV